MNRCFRVEHHHGGSWCTTCDAWENLCQVLPAVHVLTGYDYTSKIGTKHAAFMTNPEHYLEDFGTKIDESTIDKAEQYLARVLKKGTKFKKMDQFRNELYHYSKSCPYSSAKMS